LLAAELRSLLESVWPELDVVAVAGDGVSAAQALEREKPDILFLDCQMPGMTGIELARVVDGRAHIAFVTAYDQYAIQAFEEGAVDYVLKPVTAARLAIACRRLMDRLHTRPANMEALLGRLAETAAKNRSYMRWINVSRGTEVLLVTADEICYFEADTKYTRVVTPDMEGLISVSLRELSESLDPAVFWQIHRSRIVNVHAIAAVANDMRGHLTIRLKQRRETLAVSQPYAHLFRQM
jgi:DNA-binding LytR/AlgR family response regulator